MNIQVKLPVLIVLTLTFAGLVLGVGNKEYGSSCYPGDCITGLECQPVITTAWGAATSCLYGDCACPSNSFRFNNTMCVLKRNLAETCENGAIQCGSIANSECTGSPAKCACRSSYTAEGDRICKASSYVKLGAACDNTKRCYGVDENRYLDTSKVECSSAGTCDCIEGLKKSGENCIWRELDEACAYSYDCIIPGSRCIDDTCQCQFGYTENNGTCKANDEIGYRGVGDSCNSHHGYCMAHLECRTCDSSTVCVSAAPSIIPGMFTLFTSAVALAVRAFTTP